MPTSLLIDLKWKSKRNNWKIYIFEESSLFFNLESPEKLDELVLVNLKYITCRQQNCA